MNGISEKRLSITFVTFCGRFVNLMCAKKRYERKKNLKPVNTVKHLIRPQGSHSQNLFLLMIFCVTVGKFLVFPCLYVLVEKQAQALIFVPESIAGSNSDCEAFTNYM